MYATCPKCGHHNEGAAATSEMCPACGIVYRKWLQKQLGTTPPPPVTATARGEDADRPSVPAWLSGKLLHSEQKVNPFIFGGRMLAYIGMLALGWKFVRFDFATDFHAIGAHFMHNVNLVFHEAGHVLFRPFGWFMTILGGSLFQLIVPAFLAGMFVFRHANPFAGAACTWWLGQSFIDLAPYIDDALDQKLVLLGGRTGADAPGNHDWNNILGEFDVLEKHRFYAGIADTTGELLIIIAIAWGAWLLLRQYRRLEKF